MRGGPAERSRRAFWEIGQPVAGEELTHLPGALRLSPALSRREREVGGGRFPREREVVGAGPNYSPTP